MSPMRQAVSGLSILRSLEVPRLGTQAQQLISLRHFGPCSQTTAESRTEGREGIREQLEELTEEDVSKYRKFAKEAFELMRAKLTGKEPKKTMVNLAGKGRSGWVLFCNGRGQMPSVYMRDMTAGLVPDNEKNALLSRDAKTLMATMYQDGCSVEDIAAYFKVRQQRVLAILALQHLDKEREEAGEPMYREFQLAMEGGWTGKPMRDGTELVVGHYDCGELFGSGERHIRILPKAPHYETKLDAKGKPVHVDLEAAEEALAVEEEKVLVEEFRDRLMYNIGLEGPSLKRNSVTAHRPKRPKQGFSLVVKPKAKGAQPYVAEPGGKLRPLNEDEQFLHRRQRVRPRRRLTP